MKNQVHKISKNQVHKSKKTQNFEKSQIKGVKIEVKLESFR